ncbi:MAG TPA: hypothetical protein VIN35_09910 [Hydrogenophaga sp.]
MSWSNGWFAMEVGLVEAGVFTTDSVTGGWEVGLRNEKSDMLNWLCMRPGADRFAAGKHHIVAAVEAGGRSKAKTRSPGETSGLPGLTAGKYPCRDLG